MCYLLSARVNPPQIPVAWYSKISLQLGMNSEEKKETPYADNEEAFGVVGYLPFGPFSSSASPFPNLVKGDRYESHLHVVPKQSHQFYHQNSLPELGSGTAQLRLAGLHQAFNHQMTSRKILNPIYASYGESQASTGISFYTDHQVPYREREESLKSKSTGFELSCNTTSEENSFASWEEPAGTKHAGAGQTLSSWMRTTPPDTSLQSGGGAKGKQRIRWTHELHEQFVEAVNSLGGAMKATPKGILRLMKSPGLTIFHIKSHLQKYRTAKCIPSYPEARSGGKINHEGMPLADLNGNGGLHISETLRLQMDVQKSLHEHLEFQKKLQMRIEKHASYLQQMFDQQQSARNLSENHKSEKAMDPSLAGCSSARVYENHGEIFLNEPKP